MIGWIRAYLRQSWSLWLAMWFIVILLATNLAALPMVADAGGVADLEQRLEKATVAERNLSLEGLVLPRDGNGLEAMLADIVVEVSEVRQRRLRAFPQVFDESGNGVPVNSTDLFLDFWSVSSLFEKATVVEGRFPRPAAIPDQATLSIPQMEVAVGVQAADFMDVEIGQIYRPALGSFEAVVVGIVAVDDPTDPTWWGDSSMLPFAARRYVSFSPDIDELTLSMLVPTQSMEIFVTDDSDWRYVLDQEQLANEDPQLLRDQLNAAATEFSDDQKGVITGLVALYDVHLNEVAQARTTLFLLLVQSLVGALYCIAILSLLLTEQSRRELGVLASRGFRSWQLTGRFSILSLLLFGFLALPFAPFLAQVVVQNWQQRQTPIPDLSWYLAGLVVLFAWVVVSFTLHLASRQSIVAWLQRRSRPEMAGNLRQQLIFDGMILAVGLLIYWQLQRSETVLALGETSELFGQADPLLLLSPTILILALALLWRRLFPLLLRFVAAVSRRSEAFSLPIALTRLARSPRVPAQVILLITVTAALTVFSFVFIQTLTQRQQEIATFLTGADLRVVVERDHRDDAMLIESLRSAPGVTASSQAFRANAVVVNEIGARINGTLLAVERETFASVATFPPGLSEFTVARILRVLQPNEAGVPVVVAATRATSTVETGTVLSLEMGGQQADVVIVGLIGEFPSLDGNYFLTDLTLLAEQADLGDQDIVNRADEVWLNGVTSSLQQVADHDGLAIVGSAATLTSEFSNGVISKQTQTALRLNRNLLILLSALGFLLTQYFTIKERMAELAIYQALGAQVRRVRLLLMSEGLIVTAFGLMMGVGSGYLLTWMMRPLLEQTLAAALREYGLGELAIGWESLLLSLGLLLAVFGVAVIGLRLALNRLSIASSLRLVEE